MNTLGMFMLSQTKQSKLSMGWCMVFETVWQSDFDCDQDILVSNNGSDSCFVFENHLNVAGEVEGSARQ